MRGTCEACGVALGDRQTVLPLCGVCLRTLGVAPAGLDYLERIIERGRRRRRRERKAARRSDGRRFFRIVPRDR